MSVHGARWSTRGARWIAAIVVLLTPLLGAAVVPRAERTTWDGVFTDAQAKRGEAVYAANCVACHLASLTGADQVPPLAGNTFVGKWDGLTLLELQDRIRRTMPPSAPGSYSRKDVTDAIAYLLRENGFPAGLGELPSDDLALGAVRIAATQAPGTVEAVLRDYIGLYRRDALPEWRKLFSPTFTATYTLEGDSTRTLGFEDFYTRQLNYFATGRAIREELVEPRVERDGRLAVVRSDFILYDGETSRRGKLMLLMIQDRGQFRIQSLTFTYHLDR